MNEICTQLSVKNKLCTISVKLMSINSLFNCICYISVALNKYVIVYAVSNTYQ